MQNASVQVVRVAEAQWGVIARQQLLDCGVSVAGISRWVGEGRLWRFHRGVYAVGHRALAFEGRLVAALLLAGPGAVLSHASAAWWWHLIDRRPAVIDVSAPRRPRSLPAVRIHRPRRLEHTRHRSFPITPVARTLLDYSATTGPEHVRRALAEADYLRLLDHRAVQSAFGCGHQGSATLRNAYERHLPELALTRSELEREFIALCEKGGIPLPLINYRIDGMIVDAVWQHERVVVELDGVAGHGTPSQLRRDYDRELRLRAVGYFVLRYSWKQVTHQRTLVLRDLRAAIARR